MSIDLSCRRYKFYPYPIIEITLLMVDVWKKKNAQREINQNSNSYSTIWGRGIFLLVVLLCFYFPVIGHQILSSFYKEEDRHLGVRALLSICFFKSCFSRSEISGSKVLDPDCQMALRKRPTSECSSQPWLRGNTLGSSECCLTVFHNSLEGGADVLSLFYLHFFDCYRRVEPFKTCLFIIWVFLFISFVHVSFRTLAFFKILICMQFSQMKAINPLPVVFSDIFCSNALNVSCQRSFKYLWSLELKFCMLLMLFYSQGVPFYP